MTTPNEELRKLAELAIACTTQSRLIDFEKACDPTKAVALLDQLQSQAERIKELEEQHHSAMQAAEKEIEHYRLKSAAQPLPFNAELSTPQGAESSMINLPEPVAWLANYGGDVYTEAQLKQAVRDALDAQGVEDAARYRWLRDYLISSSTHFDDLIVSADNADTLDGVIDAANAKGAK